MSPVSHQEPFLIDVFFLRVHKGIFKPNVKHCKGLKTGKEGLQGGGEGGRGQGEDSGRHVGGSREHDLVE